MWRFPSNFVILTFWYRFMKDSNECVSTHLLDISLLLHYCEYYLAHKYRHLNESINIKMNSVIDLSWFFSGVRIFMSEMVFPCWGRNPHRLTISRITIIKDEIEVIFSLARWEVEPWLRVLLAVGRHESVSHDVGGIPRGLQPILHW